MKLFRDLVMLNSKLILISLSFICYGPYIPDSTSTQGGLGKIDSQCTECRTDGTSKAIGRGIVKLYNQSRVIYRTYPRTRLTDSVRKVHKNVKTQQLLLQGGVMYLSTQSLLLDSSLLYNNSQNIQELIYQVIL